MSVFGLWASGTVLVTFYTLNQQLPLCSTQRFLGISLDCGTVLTSSYSRVLGIPLELLAPVYFVVNLGMVYLIAFGSERVAKMSLRAMFGWRFIGVAIVPYLIFVELFLLHAICIYCTFMHVAIIADFVMISYIFFFAKQAIWGEAELQGTSQALTKRPADC